MSFVSLLPKLPRVILFALPISLFAASTAQANFLDDPDSLATAIAGMRSSFGDHPRVLKIEVDPDSIEIQLQDPKMPAHVDAWVYKLARLGPVILPHMSGPTPVQLQLNDPNLEANLFDLGEIDFSATAALESAAIKRAHMDDTPTITRMEIVRRFYILPKPTAGDVRWRLHLGTGRESADIYANAKGVITGADLAETRYAQTVNIFKDPALIAEAANAFRDTVGSKPTLLSVNMETQSIGFISNQADTGMAKLMPGMPANASYSWSLNGLQRRMGAISMPVMPGAKAPTPFSIGDVDWAQVGKLGSDALAKVAIPSSEIHEMRLEQSTRHPGAAVLEWKIAIIDPEGETSTVYADAKGAITEVLLPASKQAAAGPLNWLDPATMAAALSRLPANFPPDTKIVEIVFEDNDGHIVIADPSNGGQPATFDFTPAGVKRAGMTMSMNSNGPRFRIADIASLNVARLTALEKAAMAKLASRKKGYLNSLTIGSNTFDPQAGAKAVDIYVRDIPVNSAQAHYAWGLYSFEGKYIDGTSF